MYLNRPNYTQKLHQNEEQNESCLFMYIYVYCYYCLLTVLMLLIKDVYFVIKYLNR